MEVLPNPSFCIDGDLVGARDVKSIVGPLIAAFISIYRHKINPWKFLDRVFR